MAVALLLAPAGLQADDASGWTTRSQRGSTRGQSAAASSTDRSSANVTIRLSSQASLPARSAAGSRLRWRPVGPKANRATRIAVAGARGSRVVPAAAEVELTQAVEQLPPRPDAGVLEEAFPGADRRELERETRPPSVLERLENIGRDALDEAPLEDSLPPLDVPDAQPPTEREIPDLFPPDDRSPPAADPPQERPDFPEQFTEDPVQRPPRTQQEQMPIPDTDAPPTRRGEVMEECETEIEELRSDRLADWTKDRLSITLEGEAGKDFPFECERTDRMLEPRAWCELTYLWKAPALCHKPLYFEDKQLERYGHEHGPFLQPFLSGVHFFGTLPILPYKMGLRTPNECVYTLGHYRVGNCAPYMIEPLGFTWRAGLYQAGAWVAGAAIIP